MRNPAILVHQVDLDNLADLTRYAEVMRIGGQEDFGALGQQREPEDFATLARIPDTDVRFYLASLGAEILGAMELTLSSSLMPACELYIRVPSTFQGYGVGQTLLRHAKSVCRELGRTTIFGTSAARSRRDNRNARFLIRAGFEDIQTSLRQDLWIGAFPESARELREIPGVIFRPFWGGVDRAFLEDLADLTWQAERIVDDAAPPQTPEILDARIRHTAAGQHQLLTLAITEDVGRVVGFTEIMLGTKGTLAEQYDTFVHPDFRRRGIGTELKKLSMTEFSSKLDSLERTRTWLPADDQVMAQLNRNLGYTDTAFYRRWSKRLDVDDRPDASSPRTP